MEKLIEALQIFMKYDNPDSPFHCEHNRLTVCIDPEHFDESDLARLESLGFFADMEELFFYSYKYGSC